VRPAPSSDALYTAAHEAHFSQRDYGSALARWDAYIAAAPQGHFVPEAQFNRIVCLVRLGRREDAIASIRALPLAHYRRVEADRLLDRLAATP
jgi:TolA-binding protein